MKWYAAGALAAATLLAACTDSKDLTAPAQRVVLPKGASPNTPVSGAGFTSVNETVDGTGHCANGNPNNNCNIYDGKEFVWLNGGPSTAYVGDGDYFFAVLDPGGQGGNANPNDGTPKNLSDDYDAYTDRTFTVSGGIVTYSGPHDFNTNKIRLMPYANTVNPGGVYILAICSLADDYPVNPSDCKYDAFKIKDASQTAAGEPTITKDADGAYDNTFTWHITKDVDKTLVQQVGGTATFTYTVNVTHEGGTISNVKVTGTISVFNANLDAANNIVPVSITGVSDKLSDETDCTVTGGGAQSLTTFLTNFAYSCTLSGIPDGPLDNIAEVTWDNQTLSSGASLAGGSSTFTFTGISFVENKIDETVNVTDPIANGGTLGTVTDEDPSPTTFTYTRTVNVPAGCVSYYNTATFTTNDIGATGSASKTVKVCGPPKTGALTIGFWKGPNGNSLIQNYCTPSGKTSLAAYLSGLGGVGVIGPFADAAGKTCSQLVTYVNGIINGASATDMNKMLKAQMLATALDVYFTGPGYSTTASGKIKPPSNFLFNANGDPLGGFKMDVTAICPMVDNTTTGAATCKNNAPSTNGVASGAFTTSPMTMQAILDFAATTPSPFNGSTSSSIWYAGNRTKQEILKNVFDQFNNQLAFGSF